MSSKRWIGVRPRSCRVAMAAGALVLTGVWAGPAGSAASAASVDFRGELNYEAFRRAAREQTVVRIKSSPGGTGASAMALARVKGLVIDGPCNSACAWAFVRNTNACFTLRATFGFHAAHDPGTGRRITAATDYWLSTVGPALRARLSALRTSSAVIKLSAAEMLRYSAGRVCGRPAPRVEVAQPSAGRSAVASRPTEAAPSSPGEGGDRMNVAFTAAERRAAVEALRNAAFDDTSIVVASLLDRGVRLAEGSGARATAAISARGAIATPADTRSLLGELMPTLAPLPLSNAQLKFDRATLASSGGTATSRIGRDAGPA